MIRILLIRHGHTDLSGRVLYGRLPGIHLNAEGLEQAERVAAESTKAYKIDQVVTSPLERAHETAKAIAAAHRAPLSVDENLTELDFGSWVGVPFDELAELPEWREFNRSRSLIPAPGGETMTEVQARAWRAVQQAAAALPTNSTVAVVTHGDIVRCILLLVLGMSMDHIHRLEVATGSIGELVLTDGQPLVRCVNRLLY